MVRGSEPVFDDLYRELILEHYRMPRNRRAVENADVDLVQHNPVCGDEVRVTARVVNGRLEEIGFVGQGCSISQASASMMTQAVLGMPIAEADASAARFRSMVRGEIAAEDELGDLVSMQGVARYPMRVKCAVLAWDTLQKGLEGYQKQSGSGG
ncbi:MAG: SUF system NifU family Fe-S cluster assembly protein [Chloroflexi bacterium]|nr:SUF system NifU family Fe-S cluster assembly protein [Chloroflexota bacterium]